MFYDRRMCWVYNNLLRLFKYIVNAKVPFKTNNSSHIGAP